MDKRLGVRNLITQGCNSVDLRVECKREITNGTGPYARAGRQAVETSHGCDNLRGFNEKRRQLVVRN